MSRCSCWVRSSSQVRLSQIKSSLVMSHQAVSNLSLSLSLTHTHRHKHHTRTQRRKQHTHTSINTTWRGINTKHTEVSSHRGMSPHSHTPHTHAKTVYTIPATLFPQHTCRTQSTSGRLVLLAPTGPSKTNTWWAGASDSIWRSLGEFWNTHPELKESLSKPFPSSTDETWDP